MIKNRDEKENVDNQYGNDCINFSDIIPNHYIGRKKNEMLKSRKMRSHKNHFK